MSTPSTPEKQPNLAFITNEINGDKKLAEDATSIPIDTMEDSGNPCKVYKYRWVVLCLFVLYSMSNAFQWIQFSIITGIIAQFYNVSEEMVDMTSMIYMITYIPLIFPATFLLEKKVSLSFKLFMLFKLFLSSLQQAPNGLREGAVKNEFETGYCFLN